MDAVASSFTLNTGAKMPAVGLGTWQAPPGVVGQAVKDAIKVGYRHIDCASIYKNEKEIGIALQEMFEANIVAREDLWITSKLWCSDHAPEDVPEALDNTLRDLQLKYIDLYLIHWPICFKKGSKDFNAENFAPLNIPGTWCAMEKLIATGKVRSIGVSNFTAKKLQDLLESAEIVPAVNQVELHPMWQQPKLHSFCDSKGIHLSAYSPMGSPGSSFVNVKVLDHPVIKQTAEKLGKTPAQVALRWGIQSGSSVLPKSTHIDRIMQNLAVLDWSMPQEDFKTFYQIDQVRLLQGTFFLNSTSSPYKTLEELWDGDI